MSGKKKFQVEDKVFAKLRGFPAWPAKIIGIGKKKLNSYRVLFYGTGDEAVCNFKNIFPYEQYKNELGKISKSKSFLKSLSEIENDVRLGTTSNETEKTSDIDQTSVAEEKIKGQNKRSGRAVLATSKKKKITENNIKTTNESMDGQSSKSTNSEENEVSSSKGNYSSKNCTDHSLESNSSTKGATSNLKTEEPKKNILKPKETKKISDLMNEINILKIIAKKKEDKNQIAPNSLEFCLPSWGNPNPYGFNKTEIMILELDLLKLIYNLRKSLSSDILNLDLSLKIMELLNKLPFNALSLKKYKEILDTFKRVREFAYETPVEYNEKEALEFRTRVKQIQLWGCVLYKSCETLFKIPVGQTFEEVYDYEIKRFNSRYQNWPDEKRCEIVSEEFYF